MIKWYIPFFFQPSFLLLNYLMDCLYLHVALKSFQFFISKQFLTGLLTTEAPRCIPYPLVQRFLAWMMLFFNIQQYILKKKECAVTWVFCTSTEHYYDYELSIYTFLNALLANGSFPQAKEWEFITKIIPIALVIWVFAIWFSNWYQIEFSSFQKIYSPIQ